MKREKRTLLIFYLLMGYIFISFFWWILLLANVTHESFEERKVLMQFSRPNETDAAAFENSAEMNQLRQDLQRKTIMIVGEGSVFLLILLIVAWWMNRTLRREIKLNQQQKNFLLSITHELRSPIASSKVAVQTLLKRPGLDSSRQQILLDNTLHDMNRLQLLVENILLAAKIEDHSYRIGKDLCNLSEITEMVVSKIRETTSCKVETHIQADVAITGDRMALTSVVQNLVENAAKYAGPDSEIKVSVNDCKTFVEFSVSDNGPGIPDDEKKKIFQKFYRVGEEETRLAKGTGLGLYIVEKILALHRGRVIVRDNEPKGSVFEVSIPRL